MFVLYCYEYDGTKIFEYHESETVITKFIDDVQRLNNELKNITRDYEKVERIAQKEIAKLEDDRRKFSSEVKSLSSSLKFLTDKTEIVERIKILKNQIKEYDSKIFSANADRRRIFEEKKEDITKKYHPRVVEFCEENEYWIDELDCKEVKELILDD